MKKSYFLGLFVALFCVVEGAPQFSILTASAEIAECNGVLTNRPCEGGKPQNVRSPEPKVSDPGIGRKRSLLHEFTMKTIKAKEEFGIRSELKELEDFCVKTPSSIEDCQKKLEIAENELEKKRVRESKIVEEQRKIKKEEEEAKIAKTKAEANASQVTVIQNTFIRNPGFIYPPQPQPTGPGGNGYIDDHGYYVPKGNLGSGVGENPRPPVVLPRR